MRYIIIGNSITAINAIESIRQLDKKGEIVVISEENKHIYGRPLISYWLEGKVYESNLPFRPLDFYEKWQVQVHWGMKAESIEVKSKTVILNDGKKIAYDRLLVATGGKPFIPVINGLEKANWSCFYNYADVKELNSKIKKGQRALVLGGGLTGLKAMEALVLRGLEVKVIELAPYILGSILDRRTAELVQEKLENAGVEFILQNSIKGVTDSGVGQVAELNEGFKISHDILIVAIGVVPNKELAQKAGLTVNKGIIVDEFMQTNEKDIYAGGDVAESFDYLTGQRVISPILPNASIQGKIAGLNMAGGQKSFAGSLAYNAIGFLDKIQIVTFGQSNLTMQEDVEILENYFPEEDGYGRLVIKNNRLIGGSLLNIVDRSGLYVDLIRQKTDLSNIRHRLLTPDFGLISLGTSVYKAKLAE